MHVCHIRTYIHLLKKDKESNVLLYLRIAFIINLRNLREQLFKVLFLLIAIVCKNNNTSASLLIYGGDGGCVQLAIL